MGYECCSASTTSRDYYEKGAHGMAMTDEHKDALAQGRREARAIKAYLDALANRRPGRPVTSASLNERLERLGRKIESETNALKRVDLVQQRPRRRRYIGFAR